LSTRGVCLGVGFFLELETDHIYQTNERD
jgi:hypothetical protein